MAVRIPLLTCAFAGFVVSAAFAQGTNYTSVVATAGKPTQLSYHATANKNCAAEPPPKISVTEAPKNGLLIVRQGQLATNRVAGCGRISVPAQVVFYQAKNGYVGADHVRYKATDMHGQITTYDIAITVKEVPQPAPATRSGTQL